MVRMVQTCVSGDDCYGKLSNGVLKAALAKDFTIEDETKEESEMQEKERPKKSSHKHGKKDEVLPEAGEENAEENEKLLRQTEKHLPESPHRHSRREETESKSDDSEHKPQHKAESTWPTVGPSATQAAEGEKMTKYRKLADKGKTPPGKTTEKIAKKPDSSASEKQKTQQKQQPVPSATQEVVSAKTKYRKLREDLPPEFHEKQTKQGKPAPASPVKEVISAKNKYRKLRDDLPIEIRNKQEKPKAESGLGFMDRILAMIRGSSEESKPERKTTSTSIPAQVASAKATKKDSGLWSQLSSAIFGASEPNTRGAGYYKYRKTGDKSGKSKQVKEKTKPAAKHSAGAEGKPVQKHETTPQSKAEPGAKPKPYRTVRKDVPPEVLKKVLEKKASSVVNDGWFSGFFGSSSESKKPTEKPAHKYRLSKPKPEAAKKQAEKPSVPEKTKPVPEKKKPVPEKKSLAPAGEKPSGANKYRVARKVPESKTSKEQKSKPSEPEPGLLSNIFKAFSSAFTNTPPDPSKPKPYRIPSKINPQKSAKQSQTKKTKSSGSIPAFSEAADDESEEVKEVQQKIISEKRKQQFEEARGKLDKKGKSKKKPEVGKSEETKASNAVEAVKKFIFDTFFAPASERPKVNKYRVHKEISPEILERLANERKAEAERKEKEAAEKKAKMKVESKPAGYKFRKNRTDLPADFYENREKYASSLSSKGFLSESLARLKSIFNSTAQHPSETAFTKYRKKKTLESEEGKTEKEKDIRLEKQEKIGKKEDRTKQLPIEQNKVTTKTGHKKIKAKEEEITLSEEETTEFKPSRKKEKLPRDEEEKEEEKKEEKKKEEKEEEEKEDEEKGESNEVEDEEEEDKEKEVVRSPDAEKEAEVEEVEAEIERIKSERKKTKTRLEEEKTKEPPGKVKKASRKPDDAEHQEVKDEKKETKQPRQDYKYRKVRTDLPKDFVKDAKKEKTASVDPISQLTTWFSSFVQSTAADDKPKVRMYRKKREDLPPDFWEKHEEEMKTQKKEVISIVEQISSIFTMSSPDKKPNKYRKKRDALPEDFWEKHEEEVKKEKKEEVSIIEQVASIFTLSSPEKKPNKYRKKRDDLPEDFWDKYEEGVKMQKEEEISIIEQMASIFTISSPDKGPNKYRKKRDDLPEDFWENYDKNKVKTFEETGGGLLESISSYFTSIDDGSKTKVNKYRKRREDLPPEFWAKYEEGLKQKKEEQGLLYSLASVFTASDAAAEPKVNKYRKIREDLPADFWETYKKGEITKQTSTEPGLIETISSYFLPDSTKEKTGALKYRKSGKSTEAHKEPKKAAAKSLPAEPSEDLSDWLAKNSKLIANFISSLTASTKTGKCKRYQKSCRRQEEVQPSVDAGKKQKDKPKPAEVTKPTLKKVKTATEPTKKPPVEKFKKLKVDTEEDDESKVLSKKGKKKKKRQKKGVAPDIETWKPDHVVETTKKEILPTDEEIQVIRLKETIATPREMKEKPATVEEHGVEEKAREEEEREEEAGKDEEEDREEKKREEKLQREEEKARGKQEEKETQISEKRKQEEEEQERKIQEDAAEDKEAKRKTVKATKREPEEKIEKVLLEKEVKIEKPVVQPKPSKLGKEKKPGVKDQRDDKHQPTGQPEKKTKSVAEEPTEKKRDKPVETKPAKKQAEKTKPVEEAIPSTRKYRKVREDLTPEQKAEIELRKQQAEEGSIFSWMFTGTSSSEPTPKTKYRKKREDLPPDFVPTPAPSTEFGLFQWIQGQFTTSEETKPKQRIYRKVREDLPEDYDPKTRQKEPEFSILEWIQVQFITTAEDKPKQKIYRKVRDDLPADFTPKAPQTTEESPLLDSITSILSWFVGTSSTTSKPLKYRKQKPAAEKAAEEQQEVIVDEPRRIKEADRKVPPVAKKAPAKVAEKEVPADKKAREDELAKKKVPTAKSAAKEKATVQQTRLEVEAPSDTKTYLSAKERYRKPRADLPADYVPVSKPKPIHEGKDTFSLLATLQSFLITDTSQKKPNKYRKQRTTEAPVEVKPDEKIDTPKVAKVSKVEEQKKQAAKVDEAKKVAEDEKLLEVAKTKKYRKERADIEAEIEAEVEVEKPEKYIKEEPAIDIEAVKVAEESKTKKYRKERAAGIEKPKIERDVEVPSERVELQIPKEAPVVDKEVEEEQQTVEDKEIIKEEPQEPSKEEATIPDQIEKKTITVEEVEVKPKPAAKKKDEPKQRKVEKEVAPPSPPQKPAAVPAKLKYRKVREDLPAEVKPIEVKAEEHKKLKVDVQEEFIERRNMSLKEQHSFLKKLLYMTILTEPRECNPFHKSCRQKLGLPPIKPNKEAKKKRRCKKKRKKNPSKLAESRTVTVAAGSGFQGKDIPSHSRLPSPSALS